jgi:hypothetical protein
MRHRAVMSELPPTHWNARLKAKGNPVHVGESGQIIYWDERPMVFWVNGDTPVFGEVVAWLVARENWTMLRLSNRGRFEQPYHRPGESTRGFLLKTDEERLEFLLRFSES